jgi:F-type H+-transporting ATPase subunit b
MHHVTPPSAPAACETPRKLQRARRTEVPDAAVVARCVRCALFALCLVIGGAPLRAGAQPPAHAQPAIAGEAQPAPAAEGTAAHEGSEIVGMIARLVNFAILAGVLYYLLRSPIAGYLAGRGEQIRSDLVNAARMKQEAAQQIEEIERRMQALPGELEALRAQGAQEIAAEETRIRAAAAAERERLLEQARREIALQVKIAERDLVSHAADLAVGVAADRIRQTITDEDRRRLVDRYVQQLKG